MCPACGERRPGIGKPVCLACWRYVPINMQDGFNNALKAYTLHTGDQTLRATLDAMIKLVIREATERRMAIDTFAAHEELGNQRAQAGLEQ